MDQFLQGISKVRQGRRLRESSWDRTGGNKDHLTLEPGETRTFCDIKGAGKITHIWITMACKAPEDDLYLPRRLVLRMFWDGEAHPSVEAPVGDFFGMGHGLYKNYTSAPLAMSPQDGKALNCFFPMPFAAGARMEIQCDTKNPVRFYFYVDYEQYGSLTDDELRFHARWRRDLPADPDTHEDMDNEMFSFGGRNTSGEGNYVILNAQGKGHYVGVNFNVHNLRMTHKWNWYGEGDDMIFIDGEQWPPSLHGTGTEDYFNTAWCPTQEACTPYHGIILGGGPNWSGKVSLYRYHLPDPVMFGKSIRVTIEKGHANHRSDDISSTAYWYQTEPHLPENTVGNLAQRLPLPDILPLDNAIREARDAQYLREYEEEQEASK